MRARFVPAVVGVLVAGAVSVVVPSAASAANTETIASTETCVHRPAGDEARGRSLTALESSQAAVRVTAISTSGSKTVHGVPPGLARGVLGAVGDPVVGYTVVVDSALGDPARIRSELLAGLPAEVADQVQVEVSCTSAAALADAWRTVIARAWHPSARTASFGMDLDPATERIVVQIDPASTSNEAVQALRRVAPHLITVRTGGVRRGKGRR